MDILERRYPKTGGFEMWVWRKMEKISWRDMKTSEEVLQMVQEERSLMDVIWRRKKNWIGNILRGESLLREVIEGWMIGKRSRGRKRLGMLNEFLKECGTKEKGGKQERVETMEAKNLPHGRTLTTRVISLYFVHATAL